MPVDQGRYNQFQEEMTALSRGLSAREQLAVVRAKLLDFFSKRGLNASAADDTRGLVTQLLDEELTEYANKVFRRYNEVLGVVNDLYADLGVDVTKDFSKIYAIERANAAELGEFEDWVAREISAQVRTAVVEGESFNDLKARIGAISEKAALYSDTIARTQMKVVGRVAKGEKARIAEVFYFEYVGNVRGVTRAFCRALAGSTHHIDTIHQLRNGNKEPVFENCGGWRCIHDWEPDPFATKAGADDLVEITEGTKTIVLAGGEDIGTKYQEGKELSRKAALQNQ